MNTGNSGYGHGSTGAPQLGLEEQVYGNKASDNEALAKNSPPTYVPSPKHESGGWGSPNPIKSQEEGQKLLDTGYHQGKQIYNVTKDKDIVKFQPDNTPANGYHAYGVSSPKDIPPSILKKMYNDGKISKKEYNKYVKGKK